MCRLYGFIANEPTKVDCSLVFAQNALMMQSRFDARGQNNADGWGIATFMNGQPEMEKKATSAFDDCAFSSLAEKIYSSAIVAHVRQATVGNISLENTHPFVTGNWVFAHNGTVTGFAKLESELAAETEDELQARRLGQTDSEQFFLWLVTRLRQNGFDHTDDEIDDEELPGWSDAARQILLSSVKELAARCQNACADKIPRLNFVLTDGRTLFACRWNNSLHIIRRNGIYDCEICGIPHIHHHESVDHMAVAVASEPVTHESWQEVHDRTVVAENLTGIRDKVSKHP